MFELMGTTKPTGAFAPHRHVVCGRERLDSDYGIRSTYLDRPGCRFFCRAMQAPVPQSYPSKPSTPGTLPAHALQSTPMCHAGLALAPQSAAWRKSVPIDTKPLRVLMQVGNSELCASRVVGSPFSAWPPSRGHPSPCYGTQSLKARPVSERATGSQPMPAISRSR